MIVSWTLLFQGEVCTNDRYFNWPCIQMANRLSFVPLYLPHSDLFPPPAWFSLFPVQYALSISFSLSHPRPPPPLSLCVSMTVPVLFPIHLSPFCLLLCVSLSLSLSPPLFLHLSLSLSLSLSLFPAADQSLSSGQMTVIIVVSSMALISLLITIAVVLFRRSAIFFTYLDLKERARLI